MRIPLGALYGVNIQVCFFNLRDIWGLAILCFTFSMCNEQLLHLAASSTAEGSEFQETKKFNMIWREALGFAVHLFIIY